MKLAYNIADIGFMCSKCKYTDDTLQDLSKIEYCPCCDSLILYKPVPFVDSVETKIKGKMIDFYLKI